MTKLDENRKRVVFGPHGQGVEIDPLLTALGKSSNDERENAWRRLWDAVFHQGDLGVASFAVVPQIVQLQTKRWTEPDWNTFALVVSVELARDNQANPPLPEWLSGRYDEARRSLCRYAEEHLSSTRDRNRLIAMLALIALDREMRLHARLLIDFTDDELEELLEDSDV